MPLLKGNTQAIISTNIRELMHTGRAQDQAIAISYAIAKKSTKKKHVKK